MQHRKPVCLGPPAGTLPDRIGGAMPEWRGTAEYVAAMTRELSGLAGRSGLQTLAFLLEMARLEAEDLLRTDPEPR